MDSGYAVHAGALQGIGVSPVAYYARQRCAEPALLDMVDD